MAGAKLVVLYPQPTDITAFEKAYLEEHVPITGEKIVGKTKAVFSRVLGAVGGAAPFYRIAEIHFPSMASLHASLATPSTQEAAAHAVSISSGGAPIFLISEEEPVITF